MKFVGLVSNKWYHTEIAEQIKIDNVFDLRCLCINLVENRIIFVAPIYNKIDDKGKNIYRFHKISGVRVC
jgi:hypothetical protein